MKKLVLLLVVGLGSGCVSTSKLVHELRQDPASYHFSVRSIYVTIEVDRTNPTTNSLPHSINNGRIDVSGGIR